MAEKTQSGMDQNVAGLLCYIWLVSIFFVLTEKENKFVRFHAFQGLFLAVAETVLFVALSILAFVPGLWILSSLFGLASLALCIFLMIKAYQNEAFKLPVIGDMAAKNSGL